MKKILSILSILILFVLVGCQVVVNNTKEYTLPDLSNKTQEQAELLFKGAPITLIYGIKVTEEVSDGLFIEYGNGLEANDKVVYGEKIYVYFADHPENNEKVILPNLDGKNLAEIIQIMNEYDVVVKYQSIESTPEYNNLFIGYGNNLTSGSEVVINSEVIIKIGIYTTIQLPDLDGKNLSQIAHVMNELNISFVINYVDTQTIPDSLFINYGDNLVKGSEIDPETVVTINVSRNNYVLLPDLTGKSKYQIETIFDSLNVNLIIVEEHNELLNIGSFIRYENYSANEYVLKTSEITVVISKNDNIFFAPIDFPYDGPRLEAKYTLINPIDPRGGYFIAPLTTCIDGDTAKFDYPSYVDQAIGNSYASARFLNMDTQETFDGGEEEWGKPASVFTCNMLTNAESIIIQTDPDDDLIDKPEYGRLLAWIWFVPDGTQIKPGETTYTIDQYELLNYNVLQQGLAEVKYLYGAGAITSGNMSYTDWMYKAQDYAQNNGLGQWGSLLDPYWDYENNLPKGW